MKRKLISYDAFEGIVNKSLSTAQHELHEASEVLAKALNVENLELFCYGPESVVFEATDGSYVRANYVLKNGRVNFDQIEQLTIDEQTEQVKCVSVIGEMVDSLISGEEKKAEQLFSEYMSLPSTKRIISEDKKWRRVPKRKTVAGKTKIVGYDKARWNDTPKTHELSQKTLKRANAKKLKNKLTPNSEKSLRKLRRKSVKLSEWQGLVGNIYNYFDYLELGPTLNEAAVNHDDKGNLVAIAIPTIESRNKSKLLQFNWETTKTDSNVLRKEAKTLIRSADFCKSVAELKRHNALSDNNALEESLENIVSKWPNILYLTQTELAEMVKDALETVGATNYEDETCDFMAEGILRVAHNAYADRVYKILKLAGTTATEDENADKYAEFKNIVDQLYPKLDENVRLEMQVFVDLYEAAREVFEVACEENNVTLKSEAAAHLDRLLPIIQQEEDASLEIAEAAADWLAIVVETNLESKPWDVSNTAPTTVNDDVPEMMAKAKQGYSPASDFSGDWGDTAPASDGHSYRGGEAKTMRSNGFGNIGSKDTYPSLQNPYTPTPFGTYQMKGEKGVDTDTSGVSQWSSDDTWPGLQNPYVPQSVTPQSYKMKNGPETDLVVDK